MTASRTLQPRYIYASAVWRILVSTIELISSGGERFAGTFKLDLHLGLTAVAVAVVDDGERPMLHVLLDLLVVVAAANQTFRIEDGVTGVEGHLIFSSVASQPLRVAERHVAGSGAVTLVIGDDLDFTPLPDTQARVRGAQIDTDSGAFAKHSLILHYSRVRKQFTEI